MGVGYRVAEDGTVTENYWEQVEEEQEKVGGKKRKPYRIELVGVVCDAYLAVIRGIRYATNYLLFDGYYILLFMFKIREKSHFSCILMY